MERGNKETYRMATNTRHCMHWKGVVTMVRDMYMAVTPYCRCCNSFFTRYRSLCHPVTAVYDGVKDMTAKTNLQKAAAFAGIPEARVAVPQQPTAGYTSLPRQDTQAAGRQPLFVPNE